jgi:hypothetical protein
VDSNGFTASCNCGSVTRPWAELAAFSENDAHFVLCTKTNSFSTIPKSAFPSPADIAEFRALVDAKLNQDRPFTARHFDFKFEMRDYRRAYWVHTLKAGGWRRAIKALAIYAYIAYGSFILWHSISAKDPAARAALVGALVSAPLLRLFGKRKQYYLGPVRTYFSEVGLHVQYPARLGRWHWSEFIGYLEDDSVLLLYLSSKLYALIPKRALVGPAYDFNKLVMEKLSRYDHRNPSVCRSPEAPPNKVSSAAGNPSV